MCVLNKITNKAINVFVQIRYYTKKRTLLKRQFFEVLDYLEKGCWVINTKYAVLDKISIEENAIIQNLNNSRKKNIVRSILDFFYSYEKTKVINSNINDSVFQATCVIINRERQLKLFDLTHNKVLTEASKKNHIEKNAALQKPLFNYFSSPKVDFKNIKGRHWVVEDLIEGHSLGSYDIKTQLSITIRILTAYYDYVKSHLSKPDPKAVAAVANEFLNRVPASVSNKQNFLRNVFSLSERYCFVEAHLDLNPANVLFNKIKEETIFLDIADSGVKMPAFYDVIYLMSHIIKSQRGKNKIVKFEDVAVLKKLLFEAISFSIYDFTKQDFETAIFINIMFKESNYVRKLLNQQNALINYDYVLKQYYLFLNSINNG